MGHQTRRAPIIAGVSTLSHGFDITFCSDAQYSCNFPMTYRNLPLVATVEAVTRIQPEVIGMIVDTFETVHLAAVLGLAGFSIGLLVSDQVQVRAASRSADVAFLALKSRMQGRRLSQSRADRLAKAIGATPTTLSVNDRWCHMVAVETALAFSVAEWPLSIVRH